MLLISATVSVDSFFLLSGLLVAWSVFKELDKSGILNVPLMFLHRYLRLTPALAALVLFSTTLLKYVGNGPLKGTSDQMFVNTCDKWWWSTLLYVQNYVNPDDFVSKLFIYSNKKNNENKEYFLLKFFLYSVSATRGI